MSKTERRIFVSFLRIEADEVILGQAVWDCFNSPKPRHVWFHRSLVRAMEARELSGSTSLLVARYRETVERILPGDESPSTL